MRDDAMILRNTLAATAAGLALMLSGCATGIPAATGSVGTPVSIAAVTVTGSVYGGQQPVSGAFIQLYAVGNTGNQSAATPLLAGTVQTTAAGNFSLGTWNCTNTAVYGSDPLLYLVATQGNPGLGAGINNPAIAGMAALGVCSTVTTGTFISVNELTTVGSVFALAPFMSDYAHVGASNMAALKAAFATVRTLVNTANGTVPGPGVVAGETVPTATIYTLADAMAACVNSNGTGDCDTLFAATTPVGGSKPTETIGALLQIARAPTRNVPAIFGLVSGTAPFQLPLKNAPTDWTLALKFTGGGISSPTGIAIDASGNAWIANAGGGSVTGMSGQGVLLTGAGGYTGNNNIYGAQGVAVDRAGNVWLADTLLSTAVKLTVLNGAVQSSASYSTALNGPMAVAIDSQNHAWFANFGDGSVTELDTNGTPMGASPLTANGTLQAPAGIAVDGSGKVWVTDNQASVVVKFDANQTLLSGAGYSDGALLAPLGVGIDASGQAWIADSGDTAVSVFATNGSALASSPLSGGGLATPSGVALDGSGAAWVTNSVAGGSVSKVSGGAVVGTINSMNTPVSVAIDASGNVWTANSGDDSVTKLVGAATPVTTPISASVGP